jgi:hypothetical protein
MELKRLNKLLSNWKFEFQYFWDDFITNIKNVWYWLPIVWHDRNWDYSFIYLILQHKLKAQAKYMDNKGTHLYSKRDAEVMMTCVKLIDKVKYEYYRFEPLDYYTDKHWFTPDLEMLGENYGENFEENFDDYFARYPLIYKKVLKGEGPFKITGINPKDIKHKMAMNIAHINSYRAQNLLFKILNENINKWWD